MRQSSRLRVLALDAAQVYRDGRAIHRGVIRRYVRMGERARAMRHYRELAALLREQLGVRPSPETGALYAALLRGERNVHSQLRGSHDNRHADVLAG